jgi:predicted protein tyrosine phosphatase
MKRFKWCPEIAIRKCLGFFPEPHVHVCIRSVGAEIKTPECGNAALYLDFHDLDPEAIRRTALYEKDPSRGEDYARGCLNEQQACSIARFVADCPDDLLVVVNCEAGVSRSPGVVLALRRKYGGDTEECFRKAYPNIYVASMVGKELGVGPFQGREPQGTASGNVFGEE